MDDRPDICASDIIVTREGVRFAVDTPAGRRRVHFPLLGRHQVYAALAAIAVGLAHEMPTGRDRGAAGRAAAHAGPAQSAAGPPRQPAAGRLLQRQPGRGRSRAGDVGRARRPPPDRRAGRHAGAGRLRGGRPRAGGQRAAGVAGSAGDQGQARPAHRGRGAGRRHGRPTKSSSPTPPRTRRAPCSTGWGQATWCWSKARWRRAWSRSSRLLMAEPHLAPDLLVRQDAAWQQIVTICARPAHLAGDRPGRHRAQRAPAEGAGRRRAAHDLAQGRRLRPRRGPGGADRAAERRDLAGGGLPQRRRRVASSRHRRADPDPGLHARPGRPATCCATISPPRSSTWTWPRALPRGAGAGPPRARPRQGGHRHGPARHLPRRGAGLRPGAA